MYLRKDCTAQAFFVKVKPLSTANDPTTRRLRTAALGWVVGATGDANARDAAADVVELSLEYALGDPEAYRCQRNVLLRAISKQREDRVMIGVAMRVVKAAQSVSPGGAAKTVTTKAIWAFVKENDASLAQAVTSLGNRMAVRNYMLDSLVCTNEFQ